MGILKRQLLIARAKYSIGYLLNNRHKIGIICCINKIKYKLFIEWTT